MEMHPPKQHSRIDLTELKALLIRKVGPVLSKQYFYHLNRFLNLNTSKVEFNKICYRILGRENISLHNEFIQSILKNACSAKHPPPKHVKVTPTELYLPNGTHNAIVPGSNSQGLSNGDILPLSPQKARTGFRDRRSGDRFSPLGPNGKTNFASLHSIGKTSSDFNPILENGVSIPDNVQELEKHQESLIPQAQDQFDVSVKQDKKDLHSGSELQAPLGLPFCSPSVGMAHKATTMPSASNLGILLDNETLHEHMEQIATSKGLEGVSTDCANILNKGLDAYLKGLISSCVKLVSARSGFEPINSTKTHPKLVNGVKSSHLYQAQTSSKELSPEYISQSLVSLQNFRVAMELNPQQLGENWPLLLDKICSRCYEGYNTLE